MSNRKFFSGLPPGMMTRPSSNQNRQQTHFYWPDEINSEQVVSPRNRMRNRSLSTASIISQSQASTDTEESKKRRSNDLKSRIEFYDMVDTTDTESVYSRKLDPTTHKKLETLKSKIEFYDFPDSKQSQKNSNYDEDDANSVIEVAKKKEIQEVEATPPVKNNINNNSQKSNEIIDEQEIAKKMNNLTIQNNKSSSSQQRNQPATYDDSYGSESEDEMYRYQKSYRNRELPSQRYQRRPPQPPLYQQRPRRYHSRYFDDFEDDGYERYSESYSRQQQPRFPRMRRRDFSPDDISDEEFFDDRSYARKSTQNLYRGRSMAFSPEQQYRANSSRYGDTSDYDYYRNRSMDVNKNISNGYGNESRLKSPPRQQIQQKQPQMQTQQKNEIESEVHAQVNNPQLAMRPPVKPVQRSMSINEARRRHHFNLKSNIFHNDHEYQEVAEQRKPLSVRDFAANHRVGVGLPDL